MTHRELAEMIFKNKSIMNGYEPNATDDELIDYYAMLIEDHCSKQKLSIASIGSKRPTDEEIDKWVEEYAFRVPYDGSNNFYDDAAIKHAVAGAKWARDFKAACDSEKGGEKAVRDGECEHPKALYHRGYICEKCKVAL